MDLSIFFDFQRKKLVKRYGNYPENLHESVADHCSAMMDMADELMDSLNLDLDYKRVMRLIKYHDMGELGMEFDIDALEASEVATLKLKKQQQELETIESLSSRHGKKILECWLEYEKQETPESRFVKCLDKLDVYFHEFERGIEFYKKREALFTINQIKQVAQGFPILNPLFQKILELYKFELKRLIDFNWKDEYSL